MSDIKNIDLLNLLLIIKWKQPISRNYKLIIKDIWCNAKCPMCDDRRNKWDLKKIKENLKIWFKNILKEKIKFKSIQILWWEPFLLFDDILKVIQEWTKIWINFDLPSNWSLLNKKRVDELIIAWLNNFTFSIDFPNKKHDDWRKLKNTFYKIINLTNYIQDKWLKVQRNTVIWKFNLYDIKDFHNLYKKSKPNIHNFIEIDSYGNKNKNLVLNKEEKEYITDVLNKLDYDIKFYKNLNIKKSKKCYIPLKIKWYYISEKWIINTWCHYRWEIKNFDKFTINAIKKWCNKCESSCKQSYNDYMENLIKEYKLINV